MRRSKFSPGHVICLLSLRRWSISVQTNPHSPFRSLRSYSGGRAEKPGADAMSVLKRATLAAGLAACVGGVLMAMSRANAPADRQPPPPVSAAHATGYAGSASCSARACHGGDEPIKDAQAVAQQNEYTQTVMYDKHARAYGV